LLNLVDQGSIAQQNTAPEISGAVFVGKSRHDLNSAACLGHRSNAMASVLASIRKFFKDNPTWE
jgi:hypothetical protein